MITLEQFRATGRDVDDIGAEIPGMDLEGRVGRIYNGIGGLYIERWEDDRDGIAPPDGPTWLLTLYQDQYHGDLAEIEERLYNFAVEEEWIAPDHQTSEAQQMPESISYQMPFREGRITILIPDAFARMKELAKTLEHDPDAGAEESVELAAITEAMLKAKALAIPDPAMLKLFRELREEVKDWQEALCGEREGLDELCAQVDAVLP